MAGRPRKPVADLEASGAFKKDPQRKRARERELSPNPGIGLPPRGQSQEVRNAWNTIVSWDREDQVLCRRHRAAVLTAAIAMVNMSIKRDGEWVYDQKFLNIFRLTLPELGMTPASHHRIKPRKKTPVSANPAPVKKDFRSNVIGFKPTE